MSLSHSGGGEGGQNSSKGGRPLGRELMAMIRLGEDWLLDMRKNVSWVPPPKPREAFVLFSEWLWARSSADNTGDQGRFEMEVFRRMLPRFPDFQAWYWYEVQRPRPKA